MDRVLDTPMQTRRILGLFGVAGQTADVVARFDSDAFTLAPFELDLRDRAQRLPLTALAQVAQIARVRDRPAVADLEPAMAFSDSTHVIMLQLGKVNAPRPLEQPRHVFGQAFLVPLQRQDTRTCSAVGAGVVALSGHNLFGDRCLRTRCIDGHDATLQVQQPQQLGNRRDFIRFGVSGDLAQDQPVGAGPGADHTHLTVVQVCAERPCRDAYHASAAGFCRQWR